MINNEALEEGLIYKKVSPKGAKFKDYVWLYFHTMFGSMLAGIIFTPIAIAFGLYLLISSQDKAVFGVILLILGGLLLLLLMFLLLFLPLLNANRARHVVRENSFVAIYEDKIEFHYEYQEGPKVDYASKTSEIISGKEYKTRFFMRGRINGKVSSFLLSKDELDDKANERLRSLCK